MSARPTREGNVLFFPNGAWDRVGERVPQPEEHDKRQGDLPGDEIDSFSKAVLEIVHIDGGNLAKFAEDSSFYYNETMNVSDEEKIRNFIINDLRWPSEKANILAPQWAKARDFQGDAEKRVAKSMAALPEKPMREIRNRENIIEYLRSPEGFGPWVEAGALTRPLLRSISPKAYQSLVNWLRNNELPADLPIPTKSQTTDRDALNIARLAPDAIRAAKALYERERYALRKRR